MRPAAIVSEQLHAVVSEYPDAPPYYSPLAWEPTDYFTLWAAATLARHRRAGEMEQADRLRAALTADMFKVLYHRDGGAEVIVDFPEREKRDQAEFRAFCAARRHERMSQHERDRFDAA